MIAGGSGSQSARDDNDIAQNDNLSVADSTGGPSARKRAKTARREKKKK